MNEAPPVPVSDSFNISQWNATDTGKSATQSWVNRNFLSKVIADTATKLISFASGITTNSISVYSGNTISIGTTIGGQTVALYSPTTNVPVLSSTDNSIKIPNTSWVQNWFGNVVNTISLSWALAQTFTLGILTNSIKCITTSGTLNINSVDSATGGVIICGGPSQTSGVTIGNTNGITSNKIDIGSQTKTLSLTGSTIDLATALRPFYSYPIGVDKIGEIKTGTYIATVKFSNGLGKLYSTINLTKEGVYLIQAQGGVYIFPTSTSTVDKIYASVESTDSNGATYGTVCGQSFQYNLGSFTSASPQLIRFNSISAIVYNNGGSPAGTNSYRFIVVVNFTGDEIIPVNDAFLFTATRIA